ncbi:hypothetical protein Ciccas_001279 [Cichlidogyrus casuarinus]|uniref:CXXC-type zinc finger protein 1 n=1 Tax=Cichlidogyrus casuarinus TaxID=1844966 RepID=A0ABD2QKG4_9PLAT
MRDTSESVSNFENESSDDLRPRKQIRNSNAYYEESSASDSDEWFSRPRKKASRQTTTKKHVKKNHPKKQARQKQTSPQLPDELEPYPIPEILTRGPRQCIGPGCINPVYEYDTKYCSKDCGLKLALKRLEILLPQSLGIDDTPESLEAGLMRLSKSSAENADEHRLKNLTEDKHKVENKLIQLEEEHQKLNAIIAQARNFKPNPEEMEASLKNDCREADRIEQQLCIICCSEINMRHALRHMERCFQKMEGSTIFCASQKEQSIGTPLFCDNFDPQAKAYCKRLRVVCEHYKDPKLPVNTPCGYPLSDKLFDAAVDRFCATPREKCTCHFGWERRRRAQIDLQRYRNVGFYLLTHKAQLIRMDELLQEEQKIRRNKAQRFSVLGILLHSVKEHKPQRLKEESPTSHFSM